MMPEVDGLAVCRHIRYEQAELPILVVSALARPRDVQRGMEAGARVYVDEPVNPKEVIRRLHEVARRVA